MKKFKNILYVTEANGNNASAIARTMSLAENNQAKVSIIDVIPPFTTNDYREEIMPMRMQFVESLIEPYKQRLDIKVNLRVGTGFIEVIREILRNKHDLVIKAAENPVFLKRLFGSDDIHLLRKCPCPVWLMKLPEKPRYDCIVAAVDFKLLESTEVENDLNLEILDLAGSLALTDVASLHLVHVWETFAEGYIRSRSDKRDDYILSYIEQERSRHQYELNLLTEKLRERIGDNAYERLAPRLHMPKGSAQKLIASWATKLRADIVVMGTVARTGIAGLIIGNTAEAILDQLKCSVLAIKPPGFVTPVKLEK